MAYAVVYFTKDQTYSEIPTSWISEDNKKCYWPKSKNVAQIMAKGLPPENNWDTFEINIECFCETLEKARKKAEQVDYTTSCSESGQTGKRKRRHHQSYVPETSDSEEDLGLPPPTIPNRQKKNANESSHKHTQKSEEKQIGKEINVDKCDENIETENIQEIEESQNNVQIDKINPGIDEVQDIPFINISDSILNMVDLQNQVILPSIIFDQKSAEVAEHDTETMSTTTSSTSVILPRSDILDLRSEMRILLRSSGSILNYVKSIDNRLKALENKSEVENASSEFLLDILPITNIDKMKELDEILRDDGRKAAFINFIKNIGGRHTKDCVHRILKQVYSNNFGVQCSWLGQRNNIRICDTKTMTIIKEIVLSVYSLKVHDFEMYVSEWFRLSKLRFSREQAGPN